MKGPDRQRYNVQYDIWKEIISNLSVTSRMALREALGFAGIDAVELELLREAARLGKERASVQVEIEEIDRELTARGEEVTS